MYKTLPNLNRYEIFDDGDIWDKSKLYFLPFQVDKDGYLKVSLRLDDNSRKTYSVHRLVALAFIDNLENKPTVNHKDGNKLNNHYSNLEWATRSEQVQHAWDNDLINNLELRKQNIRSKQGKKVICITTGEVFNSIGEAAEKKNLKKSNIHAVCCGKIGFKSAGKLPDGTKLEWRFYEL